MQALLAEALTRGIIVTYTRKLLAVFGSELQPVESRPQGGPAHPLAELLTEREKEMLQLIAQGLSNHQIAEQLFVSLNTVKGHNRNLFGNAGVDEDCGIAKDRHPEKRKPGRDKQYRNDEFAHGTTARNARNEHADEG